MMENCHWGGDGPDDGCSCFHCVLSAFLTFQQVGMAAPFTSSELQVISTSTGTGIILVSSCAFLAVCYSLFSLRPDTPSLYGMKLHVQSSDCREVATLERCRQNWTWLLGVPFPLYSPLTFGVFVDCFFMFLPGILICSKSDFSLMMPRTVHTSQLGALFHLLSSLVTTSVTKRKLPKYGPLSLTHKQLM